MSAASRRNFQLAHLVVNALVEVLDEDVPLTSLPERRVPLGPHDAAGLVLDERVVEVLKRALSVGSADVVDVGVPERTTGDGVTADSDAGGSAGYTPVVMPKLTRRPGRSC